MPTDEIKQMEQLAQQALAAPIDKLMIVFGIGAIAIVLVFLFIGYKALPIFAGIFKSLTESYKAIAASIEKLTALEAQSSNTSNVIIDEMRIQTTAIQTSSTKTIDTLTENTEAIRALVVGFADLRKRVEDVLKGIDDKADRQEVDQKLAELQTALVKVAETAKRKTDSQPLAPVELPKDAAA